MTSAVLPQWIPCKTYEDILYEKLGHIAKITINRPEVHNAFRPKTVEEMLDALHEARMDKTIGVIILTGAGTKAFCSGGDQKIRGQAGYKDEEGTEHLNVLEFQRQMRTCPKPIIAMVAGYAIGGGHVLHMMADLTIAAENAVFGQTGPKVGSFDGGYGASYMARIVGQKKARELWFLCRQYDAKKALDMGLINEVVPLEKLEETTIQWCQEILKHSPLAIRCLKSALNADCDGQAGLQELAGNATMLFYMTEEAKEGKQSFWRKDLLTFRVTLGGASMASLKYWVLATRPKTLTISLSPVIIGTSFALGHPFYWVTLVAVTLEGVFLQILSNFANDYFDAKKGVDTEKRIGPTRVIQAGLISEKQMRIGMTLLVLITSFVTLYLAILGGPFIWVLFAVSVALALGYSGGKKAYGYLALGESVIFLLFGPMATLVTSYLLTQSFQLGALLASVSIGALATAVVLANHLRDQATDKEAGRKTLVTAFGEKNGKRIYLSCFWVALLMPLILAYLYPEKKMCLLADFTLLFLINPLQHLYQKEYIQMFVKTAKLPFVFSLLFFIGWTW